MAPAGDWHGGKLSHGMQHGAARTDAAVHGTNATTSALVTSFHKFALFHQNVVAGARITATACNVHLDAGQIDVS